MYILLLSVWDVQEDTQTDKQETHRQTGSTQRDSQARMGAVLALLTAVGAKDTLARRSFPLKVQIIWLM